MILPKSRGPAACRLAVRLVSFLIATLPVAAAVVWGQVPDGATSPVQSPALTSDSATTPILSGRVVLDGSGVPNNLVTLHRVTPDSSGEVGSALSDQDGYFRFPVPRVEGSEFTVYFATVDHLSVRFYGDPLHADSAAAAEYLVAVYDTASVLPEPVRIASRDMFMIGELTGGWEVLEIIQVLNPTSLALVSTGGMPAFDFRIPQGALDFEVGEGDVLPHELSWMDDRVLQLTPVTPGYHQIFISYRLPEGPAQSTLLIEEPTDTLNLFVRQPSHLTAVTGLQTTRLVQLEGEEFLLYGAQGLQPGTPIGLRWSRLEGAPVDPIIVAVVVTLLLLAVGVVAALRNRAQPA